MSDGRFAATSEIEPLLQILQCASHRKSFKKWKFGIVHIAPPQSVGQIMRGAVADQSPAAFIQFYRRG